MGPVALGRWLFALTLLTALGCGLVAGVFFAFSTFGNGRGLRPAGGVSQWAGYVASWTAWNHVRTVAALAAAASFSLALGY